jgi:pimeloyl-ACP methyl ester carboxylesterase
MSTVTLGDITIGYDDKGSGPPLVLIHGHPFDRSMWTPQVEAFAARGWRVIAPDLRGYGQSTVVPGTTTLSDFARDIAALLDHLGVDGFVLSGLSMGGQIAMECYRLFSGRIQGLVLADTFAAAETDEGKAWRNALADRLLREGMAPYADEVLPKMMAPHNVAAQPAVAAHVLRMMRGAPAAGAAAALRGRAERPDYVPMLPQVAVPALVVVGSDDEYTPVADAEVLRDGIPGATLVVIEGAGHLPNLERPAEFNEAMTHFLTRL